MGGVQCVQNAAGGRSATSEANSASVQLHPRSAGPHQGKTGHRATVAGTLALVPASQLSFLARLASQPRESGSLEHSGSTSPEPRSCEREAAGGPERAQPWSLYPLRMWL